MAFLRNKYILSPFKQNITHESWLSNLFVFVDSLAVMKRGNHNSLRKDMSKFPFPNTGNVKRHQMVKPRNPPVLKDFPNEPPSAAAFQRKRCLLQIRQNKQDDTSDKQNNIKNTNNMNSSCKDTDSEPKHDEHPKKKCKFRKIDRSIVPKVMGSGKGCSSQKFRSFVKCLKSADKTHNVRMRPELGQMQNQGLDLRTADSKKYANSTTTTSAEKRKEQIENEPNRKLHNIFKGQALYIARHREREKELTLHVEKMKISERMRYLMKLQENMDEKDPVIGTSPIPHKQLQSNGEMRYTTMSDKRINYIMHPSRKLMLAPYTPSNSKSDNADILGHKKVDINGSLASKKVEPLPSIGDSPINRLCKGYLPLKAAIRNKY